MNSVLPAMICVVFLALALWHFHMAFSLPRGDRGAVPSIDGKPLFVPSSKATIAVGIVLMLVAALVAATAGFVSFGLPRLMLSWLCYALALGLLARAIGDFRYVGFFKRVRGSRFARLDTMVYSPLCLLLSAGVAVVAVQNGT